MSKEFITGIFDKSEDEYFSTEGLSNSSFRLLSISNRHLDNSKLFYLSGAQFVFGSALHEYVLQPEEFEKNFAVESFEGDGLNKNSNAYKDARKTWAKDAEGKKHLTKDEFASIKGMSKNIIEMYGQILAGCQVECALMAPMKGTPIEETGEIPIMQMKGRVDAINHDTKVIVDIKTTGDIKKFNFSMEDYNYVSQGVMYQRLAKEITGNDYRCFFLVVEAKAPYMTQLMEMTMIYDEIGNQIIDNMISKRYRYEKYGDGSDVTKLYPTYRFAKRYGYDA